MTMVVNLEDLAGRKRALELILHEELRNVAPEAYPKDTNASVVFFRIGGVLYRAEEDPDDGYRSSLGEITIINPEPVAFLRYRLPRPCAVDCIPLCNEEEFRRLKYKYPKDYDADEAELLYIMDRMSRLPVLVIGTNYSDDYYPNFVQEYMPQNLWFNRPGAPPLVELDFSKRRMRVKKV